MINHQLMVTQLIVVVSRFIALYFNNSKSYHCFLFAATSNEKTDDQILSKIYHKLILSNAVVMSKVDICLKLKHIPASTSIRDQAIENLVNDKLLVIGNWFSFKNTKGIINLSGYLKGYPEDDSKSQLEFASMLAKYAIDFIDYEQSFKKNEADDFPRTLTASDIKPSKWLYSQILMDTVLSNSFLKERLVIGPSAVINSWSSKKNFNSLLQIKIFVFPLLVESQRVKRIRKSKKRFSPADHK